MTGATMTQTKPAAVADELTNHLEKQYALCNALEEVADMLPENIDKQKCLRLAMSLIPIVHAAHQFEEHILFETLQKVQGPSDHLNDIFDRLHGEHLEDEGFGEEVADGLRELASGQADNFEKVGYMLRGFFEGVRRHLAFEKDYLLPMLHQPAV